MRRADIPPNGKNLRYETHSTLSELSKTIVLVDRRFVKSILEDFSRFLSAFPPRRPCRGHGRKGLCGKEKTRQNAPARIICSAFAHLFGQSKQSKKDKEKTGPEGPAADTATYIKL